MKTHSEILDLLLKFDVRGFVHHSTIHKENPTRCNSAQQLHVQQPSTYAKPEAASAVLGS